MKRVVTAVALFVITFGATNIATAAAPEPRVALVIGNSAYADSPLANPANDARLMAETLRGLGFDVIERTDATQREMKLAIFELGDRLEAAGKDAVGLFFYAGHGVQVDGQNYLIPLNAEITKERHVAIEAVGASWVLSQMEFAGNRVNFVILDACRNNPLTRGFRSQLRGLAKMNAPTGSLVAYSTGPGDVAVDGDGVNSPYTLALSQVMQMPGLPAEKVFKLVRDAVREKTKGEQTPWEESSMTGADFYFKIDVSITVEAPEASGLSDTAAATQQETVFWQSIQNSTDPADFEIYLTEYANGRYARLARNRLKKLQETQTAALVPPPQPSIQVEEMDATFVALKTSNVRAEATTESERVGRLTRDDAVAVTGKVTDRNWYRIEYEGETAYVFGTLIKEVDPGELAAWEKVAEATDRADVERFLKDYPKGHFTERAKGLLAVLVPPPAPAPAATSVEPAVGAYPKTYQPGDTFKDCEDCPEMVVIPAGEFMMGSPSDEEENYGSESPQHWVTIRQPFAVGKYELLFREWDACVTGGGCNGYRPDDAGWGRDNRPVMDVSWDDAQAYLRWLSRMTGAEYRLLSEAEWEYAARAGTTTPFHFGSTISTDQANYNGNYTYGGGSKGLYRDKTVPVGSFPSNAFGLHDVHGNVREWVEDCWNGSYAGGTRLRRCVDDRKLQPSCLSRRLLGRLSERRALGGTRQAQDGHQAVQRPRVPRCQDAAVGSLPLDPLNLYLMGSRGHRPLVEICGGVTPMSKTKIYHASRVGPFGHESRVAPKDGLWRRRQTPSSK